MKDSEYLLALAHLADNNPSTQTRVYVERLRNIASKLQALEVPGATVITIDTTPSDMECAQ